MNTIWYRVIEHCEESYYELARPWLDLSSEFDQGIAAESCAYDYHQNHDGWECSWPLTFALHAEEGGPEIARLVAEIEMEPSFIAKPAENERLY